jgi:chromosome segregation ATPase
VQTLLHNEGAALQETLSKQAAEIQADTNKLQNMDAEIAGLSTRINELKRAAMTNEQTALEQSREILRLGKSGEGMSNQIVQYKEIVDKLEAKLKEASEGITKQNAAIQQLASERDEAIKKYNDSIKERNALAEKYNNLVERYNKLQAAPGTEGGKPASQ